MFIRFFRSNSPSAFLLLPLVALVIWAMGLMEPSVVPVKHAMPLYSLLASPFVLFPWLGTLTALVLILAEAFLINHIVNENEVLTKQSYLPALFYILLMSNNNSMLAFHPLIPANLFMLFAMNKLLSSYRQDSAFSQSFDAGLLISLATLFYFPYIFFFPLLGIGLIILRPFNWREWFISFLGVLIPYLFTITIYFWTDFLDYLWYDKMFYPVMREKLVMDLSPGFYLLMGLGWGILLLSFGKLLSRMGGGSQRSKKGLLLFLWFFILGGLTILISPEISSKYFSALAIPACVFYSFFFLNMKKEWLGELLFLLFYGSILFNLIQHYF